MFSSDAILQTIGTIIGTMLGAFLGGFYAVRVMNNQINFQKKLLEEDKREKFEKTYWLIKIVFGVLGDAMVSAHNSLTDPAIGEKPNYGYIVGKLISCLDQANGKLFNINEDNIHSEAYKSYLGGKTLVEGARMIITRIHNRYLNQGEDFYITKDEINDLKSYGNGLNQMLKEIEMIRDK